MKKDEISIFVVDDDKLLSGMLKKEIKHQFPEKDLHIYAFETGEFAEAFINNKPDIAIIDYHLNTKHKAAKNGLYVIRQIKAKSPGTDVIFLTGNDSQSLAKVALDMGANTYVFKNEDMFDRLNIWIDRYITLRNIKREAKHKMIERAIIIGLSIIGIAFLTILQIMK